MSKTYRGDLIALNKEFNEFINHLMNSSGLDYTQASDILFKPLVAESGRSLSELIRTGNVEKAWKIVNDLIYQRRQVKMQRKKEPVPE